MRHCINCGKEHSEHMHGPYDSVYRAPARCPTITLQYFEQYPPTLHHGLVSEAKEEDK